VRAKWRVPLIVGVSVAGVFWVVATSLLLASWRSNVEAARARNAPICALSQVFSAARCQGTLPGMMTKITGGELDVTVNGHSIHSVVTLAGHLPHTSPAIPVQVTLYRGRVIHVEDEAGLAVNTDAAPATKALNYRMFGLCALVFGTMLGAACAKKTHDSREAQD
jgi:hypothetical protein